MTTYYQEVPPLLHFCKEPPSDNRIVCVTDGRYLYAARYQKLLPHVNGFGYVDAKTDEHLLWAKTWQELTDPKPRVRLIRSHWIDYTKSALFSHNAIFNQRNP